MGRAIPTSPIATPLSPSQVISPRTPPLSSVSGLDAKPTPPDHLASVIESLRGDPSAAPFLDPDRTPAEHVGAAVRDQRVQPALSAAQAASTQLASAVRDEVVLQKEALLAEVDAVAALEKEVATVEAGVQSLAAASGALADALAAPYEPMTRAVTSLQNIGKAAALLRAVERFAFCTRKLSEARLFPTFSASQKTPPEALPAAAEAIYELDELLGASPDLPLDKVDVVSKHIAGVRKAGIELRKRTGAILKAGIAAREQRLISAAVAAFHSLGVLPDRINAEVGRLLAETQTALQRGLEPPRVTPSASSLSFPTAFGARSSLTTTASSNTSGASGEKEDLDGSNTRQVVGRPGGGGGSDMRRNGPNQSSVAVSDSGTSNLKPAEVSSRRGGSSEPSWEVWSRVEAMLDTVRDSCLKAILLQQVLGKKYDEVKHVSLLHEPIASGFVDAVAKALGEQISLLARTRRQRASAAEVFRALTSEYPRLRSLLVALAARVHSLARTSPHPITAFELERAISGNIAAMPSVQLPIVPDQGFIENSFLAAVSEVEEHYLSASLDRLTSAVSAAFEPGRSTPSEPEALGLVRLCSAELSASRSDSEMFFTSTANVATALRLYCSNAEGLAAAHAASDVPRKAAGGGSIDSRSRSSGPVRDWRLTPLANGLVTLCTASKRVLGADEEGAGPLPVPIAKEVDAIGRFADSLLEAPFALCTARVTRAIENIHTEDLTCDPGSDDGCSVYAVDVTAQLSMFASGVVNELARSRRLGQYTLTLAHRVLNIFVVHATLAFPLNVAARGRLATDMARIEHAVESLCPVRMLGDSYLAVRALRQLVFLSDEDMCQQPPAAETLSALSGLPPSAFAHHMFSRCSDPSFIHPHRRQNSTPGEYAMWLDGHTEEEAWASVESAVSAYEDHINGKEEDPCQQYLALNALSGPLRDRWTSSRASNSW